MSDCEDATAHEAKTVTLNLVTVTIEIPEDRDARFQRQGQARGLTVDRWLLELAEQNAPALPGAAPPKRTFAEVCAKVRGLADDLDFSRDPSPGVTSFYERFSARHEYPLRDHSCPSGPSGQCVGCCTVRRNPSSQRYRHRRTTQGADHSARGQAPIPASGLAGE